MSFSKMYSMSYYVSKLKSPDSSVLLFKIDNNFSAKLYPTILKSNLR
jgi:hypothetical protein